VVVGFLVAGAFAKEGIEDVLCRRLVAASANARSGIHTEKIAGGFGIHSAPVSSASRSPATSGSGTVSGSLPSWMRA
jgi:hypothetical protein